MNSESAPFGPASKSNEPEPFYIFAYGSLIWRPDFFYEQAVRASVPGYERRFWQASHDHRGTPQLPGRVVTMVAIPDGQCEGIAYRLPSQGREAILHALDEREQDGYGRTWVNALAEQGADSFRALTWMASPGNPSWVGDESLAAVARLIANRHGPSGSNREYLMRLHLAFNDLGILDTHIEQLVELVLQHPD